MEVEMEEVSRVRTILMKEDHIIFIKRVKYNKGKKEEYYTFPGGGIEEGECFEQTALREIKEEIGIEATYIKPLYVTEFKEEMQIFAICEYVEGIIGTGDGPEYLEVTDTNQFIPVEMPIAQIELLEIRPNHIKEQLLQDIKRFGGIYEIPILKEAEKEVVSMRIINAN